MMFDPAAIEKHGWRQGAVLGPELLRAARERAPEGIHVADDDWLIVTSHDCDVVNSSIEKEPSIEVLRAGVIQRKVPDKMQADGRNPRVIQFAVNVDSVPIILGSKVHERWTLPREWLAREPPVHVVDTKSRRLLAEWLAKRYIRAAFPTEFDRRWRASLRDWTGLLAKHSEWIQGIYMRLSSLGELNATTPYKCHIVVAAPWKTTADPSWPEKRLQLESEVEGFWSQFVPLVECEGVDVLGTNELTLADIETYQRFDADWVSFADDTAVTPLAADMLE